MTCLLNWHKQIVLVSSTCRSPTCWWLYFRLLTHEMNHWPVTQNTLGWFCKFHLLFDHFNLSVWTYESKEVDLDADSGLCIEDCFAKGMYSKCLCCTWHTLQNMLEACVQFLRFLSELYSSSPLLCDWTLTFASSSYMEHVTCMSATFYEHKIPWNLTTCCQSWAQVTKENITLSPLSLTLI